MATRTPTFATVSAGCATIAWTPLTESDTCTGALIPGSNGAVGAMMVTGTFGGATITLQGSNDGSNYYNITDPAGNTVNLSSAGIKEFSTGAVYVRAGTASGSSSSVTVTLSIRG